MAINLTNPMSGDAFKKEIEKALDTTTGGVINGKIYKENEEPSSEYITKKYIDDFIHYLNNVSPVTLKRNSNGVVQLSNFIDVDTNSFEFVNQDIALDGATHNWTNVYSFNINKYSLGYKSPSRTIRINLSQYCSDDVVISGSYKKFSYSLRLKDEDGNVVDNHEVETSIWKGNINFYYDINTSELKENMTYSIDVDMETWNSKYYYEKIVTYKLSFQSLQERAALRNIIEY